MSLAAAAGGVQSEIVRMLAERRLAEQQAVENARAESMLSLNQRSAQRADEMQAATLADRARGAKLEDASATAALMGEGDQVPPEISALFAGTPQAALLDQRTSLPSRSGGFNGMPAQADPGGEPVGTFYKGTPQQRQINLTAMRRRGVEADPSMPPAVRRLMQMQGAGVSGVQADDLESPDERAARERGEDARTVSRAGQTAEAQARAASRYRPDTGGSRELMDELRRVQIDAARGKVDEADRTRETAATAARTTTQDALATARRMQTHPGLSKSSGIISSRLSGLSQDAANFDSLRNQLVAALAQPNLGALKGPMSDKDILFVKQLATRLSDTRMSDDETQTALNEAVRFLESKAGTSGASASAPADDGWTTLPNGARIRQRR